ncbi:iron-only hydrogenase maturation protein HydG [Thermanaeromonas toyohensis ToBE]|uniref:Iron-only hydrogenase maturation protein HydG n=1 Tax=Thermanaeromonas toyohensis ToBE TaxID=698762 RepID=A0A1W1VHD0_9FIRM|nr:[FeFe] hydrogenase H-cluster radical SAM maturase HydG [Thermanaeromonas toyohensis]SMB92789.1 iron-only hydrogenase maturation protein HydG [Thermanaeromonas toyohensis ToBE]
MGIPACEREREKGLGAQDLTAIVDPKSISELLSTPPPGPAGLKSILRKARELRGLTLEEAAALLNLKEESELQDVYAAAGEVKQKVYGRRIVLFAPLYISNRCSNNCLYCGFRRDNRDLKRKVLTPEEIGREARALADKGFQRVLLVAGEGREGTEVDYLVEAVQAVYRYSPLRIVHLNVAPQTVAGFRRLKEAGAGVYQCFQETYHPDTYKLLHPSGPKADYGWRLTVMHRAMEGGFGDVGMGALLGLYDYRFEVLASISHAWALERDHGAGPHTMSVPRMRPAKGAALTQVPYPLSDTDFRKVIAVYRLALPYVGLVLTTRERPELRDELIHIGVSQMSAGSCVSPGGYAEPEEPAAQFEVSDHRPLERILEIILSQGYLPSFCTACYRVGRTGGRFTGLARQGDIKRFCLPNALLSFKEYLLDKGTRELRKAGEKVIAEALEEIEDMSLRQATEAKLSQVEKGFRDIYF